MLAFTVSDWLYGRYAGISGQEGFHWPGRGHHHNALNLAQSILIGLLRGYRVGVSPLLAALTVPFGLGCRFTPTCSQYALEAIHRHGALRGSWLAARRVLRCQPWGGCGHDPVPPVAKRGATPEIPGNRKSEMRHPKSERSPKSEIQGKSERPPRPGSRRREAALIPTTSEPSAVGCYGILQSAPELRDGQLALRGPVPHPCASRPASGAGRIVFRSRLSALPGSGARRRLSARDCQPCSLFSLTTCAHGS